jgi:hypothetical protein
MYLRVMSRVGAKRSTSRSDGKRSYSGRSKGQPNQFSFLGRRNYFNRG